MEVHAPESSGALGAGKSAGRVGELCHSVPHVPLSGEQPVGAHTALQLGEVCLRKKVTAPFYSLRRAAVGMAVMRDLIYLNLTRV